MGRGAAVAAPVEEEVVDYMHCTVQIFLGGQELLRGKGFFFFFLFQCVPRHVHQLSTVNLACGPACLHCF